MLTPADIRFGEESLIMCLDRERAISLFRFWGAAGRECAMPGGVRAAERLDPESRPWDVVDVFEATSPYPVHVYGAPRRVILVFPC
jgi:hypothetical protein